MTNLSLSKDLIQSLASKGLKRYVICAGARNAPLIKALEVCQGVEVEEYFEERAAGFYALGLAKVNREPVAVITTSGTAVANLYPAVMEAHYSGLPLVVITADRPESYRGTGAPQSVNQVNIFGEHVASCYDITTAEPTEIEVFKDSPVHINICFDEPLLDEELESYKVDLAAQDLQSSIDPSEFSLPVESKNFNKPLVIIGSLHQSERQSVLETLSDKKLTVYAEAHSGLRSNTKLNPVQSGEFSIRPEVFKDYFDSVIRIGGVPTLRLWRDLEDSLFDIPVASFSSLNFSGLSRSEQVAELSELESFIQSLSCVDTAFDENASIQNLQKARSENPNSEVSVIGSWAEQLAANSNVLLGNSLPIREWELAAPNTKLTVYSNRGVNGIDGLIATACGIAESSNQETYVLLGDLSALYDLSSLALVSKIKTKVTVVVVNNGGGMIFRRIFNNKLFENQHDWNFTHAGKMFGLEHGQDIIELKPDEKETENFWKTYQGRNS